MIFTESTDAYWKNGVNIFQVNANGNFNCEQYLCLGKISNNTRKFCENLYTMVGENRAEAVDLKITIQLFDLAYAWSLFTWANGWSQLCERCF